MDSQNNPKIPEDYFDIDSYCVEEFVEEIEIDEATQFIENVEFVENEEDFKRIENVRDVEPIKDDEDVKFIDDDDDVKLIEDVKPVQDDAIVVLLHTVGKQRTSIVGQKRESEPERIVDGCPSGSKNARLSSGTSQCRSDVGWKIADELFADETDATEIATSSKHAKTISNLPEEVLEEIMKWFPCTTRKNAKLVCKYWYAVCSRIFDSKEKMFVTVHNDHHLDEVLSVLSKSTREHLRLEFYGSDFSSKPRAHFWKASCGPRILSLKLTYCHLSAPSFANMLKGCTNLQTLELDFHNIHFNLKKKMHIINPNKTLTEDLSNPSLKTLKVSFGIDYNYLDNRLYVVHLVDRLFQFFPNMSNFSLHHRSLMESVWFTSRTQGNLNYESYHDRRMRELVPLNFVRRQMENVAINYFLLPGLQWHTFLEKAEALTKFTEIAIDIGEVVNMELLKKFVQNQIHLRSITCVAIKRIRETLLIELIGILWKVPSLCEFQLVYKNVIHWNASYLNSLSASNIKSLKIFCHEINFSKMKNLPILCEKLTSLAVQAIKVYDSSIVQMLNSFPNLEELYLSHMNNTMLESICSNQTKLQSLHVQKVLGPVNSVNQLQNIKQLRRLEIPPTDVLVEVENFTCLTHLHICRSYLHESYAHNDSTAIFEDVSFSLKHLRTYFCPSLETVRLDSYIKPEYPAQFVETVTEFVAGLKFLKFLSFSRLITSALTLQDVSAIFKQRPSLEVLIVRDSAYFKDVIGGCIRRFDKKTNWDSNFNEYELVTKYMNAKVDRHQWDFFFHRISAGLYQNSCF